MGKGLRLKVRHMMEQSRKSYPGFKPPEWLEARVRKDVVSARREFRRTRRMGRVLKRAPQIDEVLRKFEERAEDGRVLVRGDRPAPPPLIASRRSLKKAVDLGMIDP